MAKYNPATTYRIQFHKEFSLNELKYVLNYLFRLGIKTVYASPIFGAVKGSMHGYDVTDPQVINPDIGSDQDFEEIVELLKERGMGWVQDIVPNHMAFSTENPWIHDVLEKGKNSPYFDYFDFTEDHPDELLNNKIMLPFFGKTLDNLISDKELSVRFSENGFQLHYFDNRYPLSSESIQLLLESNDSMPEPVIDLVETEDSNQVTEKSQKLFHLGSDEVKNYVEKRISEFNANPDKLKNLIGLQHYYPAFWQETEIRINYRRFFTINGLISINIQNKKVYESTHKLIRQWINSGKVQGLRVDHIDGLYHPVQYLERLREMAGISTYIVVEKILEKDEEVPSSWPVEGTSGYDFLGLVNNLLTNPEKGPEFYSYYKQWVDKPEDFEDIYYRKSRFILYKRLLGDLENLSRECMNMPSVSKHDFTFHEIKSAIGEFLIFCPVYKIYGIPGEFSRHELKLLKSVFDNALQNTPQNKKALKTLQSLFLLKNEEDKNELALVVKFFRHCMQFTGPLMAKGIEDTAFYSYAPFICHNEVGDSPGFFGIRPETFHMYMHRRQKKFPLTMNCISTHDTKRGEDARARLNVLSDIPQTWIEYTSRWRKINSKYKSTSNGKEIPTSNDEYFIYQAIVAHAPLNGQPDNDFITRLNEYLLKAMREAKENSSWSNPDENYEKNTMEFVSNVLSGNMEFKASLQQFLELVIPHGIINSISQLILKNMVPGVPDTYQGTELWNFSFVDPDNRKPVDYPKLAEQLNGIIQNWEYNPLQLAKQLWSNPTDDKLKHWITWITLQERRQFEPLFLEGNYIPLKIYGTYENNLFAFYRNFFHDDLIVVVPVNTINLKDENLWDNTWIELPGFESSPMENRLTGEVLTIGSSIAAGDLFKVLPFAILRNITR